MIEQIGVIIPTYNRHNFLARQLDWLTRIGIMEIVVMDASIKPYPDYPSGIHYHHMPGVSFGSRIKFAIDQIKSPVAVLLGDDDYLAPAGCIESLKLLLNDLTIASAQGRYVTVFQKSDSCQFVSTYESVAGLRIDSMDRNERLKKWLSHYMHSIYAPRRTERMRAIVKSLPENEKNPILVEMAYAIADAWFGKHINFKNTLYMIRSDIVGSGGKTIPNIVTYLKNNPHEYEQWVNEFCQNFSKATQSDAHEFRKFWDDGIGYYQNTFLPLHHAASTPIGFIKKLVPKKLQILIKKHVSLPQFGPLAPLDQWILDSKDFKDIKSHIEQHPLN